MGEVLIANNGLIFDGDPQKNVSSFSFDPARMVLLIGYRFVFLLAREGLTFSSPVQEALSCRGRGQHMNSIPPQKRRREAKQTFS
jgi:hypothetical protein